MEYTDGVRSITKSPAGTLKIKKWEVHTDPAGLSKKSKIVSHTENWTCDFKTLWGGTGTPLKGRKQLQCSLLMLQMSLQNMKN